MAMSYAWELRCKSSRTRNMPPVRRVRELCCRSCRTRNMPPVRRCAPHCPPNSTSFVGGRPRDDFGTQVRFWVPSCNSSHVSEHQDAKRQLGVGARGKPPNLGVANAPYSFAMAQRSKETQRDTTAGAICGGHVMRSAKPTTKLPKHNSLPNRKLLVAKRRLRVEARVCPLFQA